MEIYLKKDKIFLRLNIERCRELYDTKILFEGGRNPFVQSVFIEMMILLRHLEHIFNNGLVDGNVVGVRDAGAHPYLNREIKGSGIFVEFGRNYIGNWKYTGVTFEAQDDTCDVCYQYGDSKISAREIQKMIEKFEKEI